MDLHYSIKKETWMLSNPKYLKSFLEDWDAKKSYPRITGDLRIYTTDGTVIAERMPGVSAVQVCCDKELLLEDEVIDWFVMGIKALLKKDVLWTLYFDFKQAIHNAFFETNERTFLRYTDKLGFRDVVEVKALFGKSLYDLKLRIGKKEYTYLDYTMTDDKFTEVINKNLDWLEEDFREWSTGEKNW